MSGFTLDNLNDPMSARDPSLCTTCGKPIEVAYATFGGNWVPFIPAKPYHMGCIPFCQPKPASKWTVTPMGMLMYDGYAIGDLRNRGMDRIQFILAALNAAEEKL